MKPIQSLMILAVFLISSQALAEISHKSELAVILKGGNSDSDSVSLTQKTTKEWTSDLVSLSGRYLVGSSSGILSARQWGIGLRYERKLSPKFSLYTGPTVEGDTFSGYEKRYNYDLGGKYTFFKENKKNYFFNETGYRYTSETLLTMVSNTSHKLRTYFEYGTSFSETAFFVMWVEILPDLSNSSNFLLNFEPSFNVALSSVLSLKLAYLGNFDNLPNVAGNDKLDYTFTTALVADF